MNIEEILETVTAAMEPFDPQIRTKKMLLQAIEEALLDLYMRDE